MWRLSRGSLVWLRVVPSPTWRGQPVHGRWRCRPGQRWWGREKRRGGRRPYSGPTFGRERLDIWFGTLRRGRRGLAVLLPCSRCSLALGVSGKVVNTRIVGVRRYTSGGAVIGPCRTRRIESRAYVCVSAGLSGVRVAVCRERGKRKPRLCRAFLSYGQGTLQKACIRMGLILNDRATRGGSHPLEPSK